MGESAKINVAETFVWLLVLPRPTAAVAPFEGKDARINPKRLGKPALGKGPPCHRTVKDDGDDARALAIHYALLAA
jgi:hypothetical protein